MRSGRDLTILTYGASLWKSLTAAETLAKEGIDAEVIDLRVLRPLDDATIMDSVRRTHRVLIVDEGWRSGGISAEISAASWSKRFTNSNARSRACARAEVPIPYAKHLEQAALPQVETITAAARELSTAMAEFNMPSLGADMEAATLMTWSVKPGDPVKRGDVIAEVETDKGLIEIEVFDDGVIEELVAQIGDKLPVGAVLAVIRETGAAPAAPAEAGSAPAPAPEKHVRISPLARKVAAELGVDLATLTGTGPGGAIERADVERAASEETRAARAASRRRHSRLPRIGRHPHGRRCAAPSPPPWRSRTAKSRITIWPPAST